MVKYISHIYLFVEIQKGLNTNPYSQISNYFILIFFIMNTQNWQLF